MSRQEKQHRVLEQLNAYKLGWLRDSIQFIVLIAVLLILFRCVIGLAYVRGDSMDPALKDGTVVVYLRTERTYRAGDVISMRVPSGDYYVKRVIAVGGDEVALRDGAVLVNGMEIEEPRVVGETEAEQGAVIYPYLVRPGNVFVLGDNRAESMDSRAFGEVNRRQIRGKLILQIGKDGIHKVK